VLESVWKLPTVTPSGIAFDGQGDVYVTGIFQGTATFGTTTLTAPTSPGNENMFLAKYDAGGNVLFALACRAVGDLAERALFATYELLENIDQHGAKPAIAIVDEDHAVRALRRRRCPAATLRGHALAPAYAAWGLSDAALAADPLAATSVLQLRTPSQTERQTPS
jgi:hypothetical protein